MKSILVIFTCLLSSVAFAQTVNVPVNAEQEGTTTIQIKKGSTLDTEPASPTQTATSPQWTTDDGTAEVEGEPSGTTRDARAAWKKACEDWKKEFRADNKDNKIVTINCGSASCSGDVGSKICTSTASYKIKTRDQ